MEAKEGGDEVRSIGSTACECGTNFPLSGHRFHLFLPLHLLWLGYMTELLSLSAAPSTPSADPSSAMPAAAGMHAKLIKADFHGAIVTGAHKLWPL